MPARPLANRALSALLIAASYIVLSMPAPVLGLDPPRPVPGYRPTFVTEREPGVWEDCIWAAGSMLLDKWTNGATTVDRDSLRVLSGDLDAGSTLVDLKHAVKRLGIALKISPRGGDSVAWSELLDRLGQGGGAILLGDYGKLPRKYGRWDPSFWNNEGALDDHALYLDSYDRRTGRILVMDPLAPAGWGGEWVPVSALMQFAWRTHWGALWTAMTPAALDAPFDGVDLGYPSASADASSVQVRWPIQRQPEGWAYAGASITTQFTALQFTAFPYGDLSYGMVSALPASEHSSVPAAPSTAAIEGLLTATFPLPTPGIYALSVTVTDNRFGLQVVTAGPFTLYVPGPRAATYVVPDDLLVDPGALAHIPITVRNVGIESWVDAPSALWLPRDVERPRNTRLVGTWLREAPAADEDRGLTPTPPPIDFGPLALEPGSQQLIDAYVQAPADPGYWRLVLDVVDDEIGSIAQTGSAPGIVVVEVLAPGRIAHSQ